MTGICNVLSEITPVILTYNEAPNIGRTLGSLRWARRVVVVDSFSDDETAEIVGGFPNAQLFQRRFDTHAAQWNYAVSETGIHTAWTLALDADYLVGDGLEAELAALAPDGDVTGYSVHFEYWVFGRPLRGSMYPPVTVLFRTGLGSYRQDGHTQRLALPGRTMPLRNKIRHDDRKPLSHWVQAQLRYTRLEAEHLQGRDWVHLSWPDRLRRTTFLAPPVVFFYCLLVKMAILDGKPGWYYAFQRLVAELLLAMQLLQLNMDQDPAE